MKKVLGLFLSVSLIAGMVVIPVTASASTYDGKAYKVLWMSGFDDELTGFTSPSGSASSVSYSNPNGVGSIASSGDIPANIEFSSGAPTTATQKLAGSTYTVGDVDKSLQISFPGGSAAAYDLRTGINFDNVYGKKLKVSLNIFTGSHTSENIDGVQLSFRTVDGTNIPIMTFRVHPTDSWLQLQFPGQSTHNLYTRNKWHNVTVEVDTATMKYSALLNGSPLANAVDNLTLTTAGWFHGGAGSNEGQGGLGDNRKINGIRIASNTGGANTRATFYIDDLFIGEEVTPATDYVPTSITTPGADVDIETDTVALEDLKTFEVVFPQEMNKTSLDDFVTLTRGAGLIVPSSRSLDATGKIYTVTLAGSALPESTYTLAVKPGARTTDNITLDKDVAFSVTTAEQSEIVDYDGKVYKARLMTGFDNLNGIISTNASASTGTYSNQNGVASIYADTPAGIDFSSAVAPQGTKYGSTYTIGDTDDALKINLKNVGHSGWSPPQGETRNSPYFFNRSISSTEDLSGTLIISANFYVESMAGGGALFLAEFRNADKNTSQFFAVRTGPQLQIANSGTTVNANYSTKQWNNITVTVDTAQKKFSVSLNGSPISTAQGLTLQNADNFYFPGVSDEGKAEGKRVSEIRFSATPTTNQAITSAEFYIDDLFIGTEVNPNLAPVPVFGGTTGASDRDNGTASEVPTDLKSFKVSFPYDMNELSLTNFVRLTRGETNVPVEFTPAYNQGLREYTATLNGDAIPNTEYTLTFKRGIRTVDNIMLDKDVSFKVRVEPLPFSVEDIYFTKTDNKADRIDVLGGEQAFVYGNIEYSYTEEIPEDKKDLIAAIALYKGNKLVGVGTENITITPPVGNEVKEDNIQFALNLENIEVDETCVAKLFLWNKHTLVPVLPDEDAVKIGARAADLSGYTILYRNNFDNFSQSVSGTDMTAEVASVGISDDELPGNQGNTLKLFHKSEVNSNMPWFALPASITYSGGKTVVIDFKKYSVNGTAPFVWSVRGGANPNLIRFNPDKALQNTASNDFGTYSTGVWERYRIVIRMTASGNTYEIYKGGVRILDNMTLSTANDSYSPIRITYAKSGNPANPSIAYLDDIMIYEGESFLSDKVVFANAE